MTELDYVEVELPDGDYVSNEDMCTACGKIIDGMEDFDLKAFDFQATGGGVQPGTPDSPIVHWTEGTMACPHCGARLWIQVTHE